LIRNRDAHECGGEQPGLVLQRVGRDVGSDDDHERDRVAQKVGHEAPPENEEQQSRSSHAHADAYEDLQEEAFHHVGGGGSYAR